MECGKEVQLRDVYGNPSVRIIAQCHGRFMMITHGGDYRNGYLFSEWHGVLREIVSRAVPATFTERQMTALGNGDGSYHSFPVTYPLSAADLAGLLGVPVGEVREQLQDMVVQVDG